MDEFTSRLVPDGLWNVVGALVPASPLGTIGGLVGVVALTQIVVLLGGGSWFPYAAPSLWRGMGGTDAAAVAPLATAAVVHAWWRPTKV